MTFRKTAARRRPGALALVVASAAALAVALSACSSGSTAPPPPMGTITPGLPTSLLPRPAAPNGTLSDVTAPAADAAWAVGYSCASPCAGTGSSASQPLVLHWNGSSWTQAAISVSGLTDAVLDGVSSAPHGTAWAVGGTCAASCGSASAVLHAVILGWDGHAWSQSITANDDSEFTSVAASPDGTAWAVGSFCVSTCSAKVPSLPLTVRWNGTAWSQQRPLAHTANSTLLSVSAAPHDTAWAVGYQCAAGCGTGTETDKPLILHWTGHAWSRTQVSATDGRRILLGAVATAPDGTAWAVGSACLAACATPNALLRTLALRWNGTRWTQTPTPSPDHLPILQGVSAESGGTAWAVGQSCLSGCGTSAETDRPLILRWNGRAWSQTRTPSPYRIVGLSKVATAPGGTAWAVGEACTSACGTQSQQVTSLILRWTGSAWSVTANRP